MSASDDALQERDDGLDEGVLAREVEQGVEVAHVLVLGEVCCLIFVASTSRFAPASTPPCEMLVWNA